jgi:excisionase family DNA binding protein
MRKISANDDLMTTREAGEKLGVAVRTVQLWVEAGLLPAWRTAGGHRRIARGAVEALMAERAQVFAKSAHAVPVADPVDKPKAQLRVLVVEDDPIQLHLTLQVMGTWQLPLVLCSANNGFEALLRIGEDRPDLVITDLHMPGMDGFQMLQALKQAGSGYETMAVVVLSALSPDQVAQAGGLPVDITFLPKPVHYGELEALVRPLATDLV